MDAPSTLEVYLDSLKAEGVFAEAAGLGNDLRDRIWAAIADGLRDLDRLPRVDPFWQNTNHRTTIYKLANYVAARRAVALYRVRAAWWGVALALYYGSNDFGCEHWQILLTEDSVSLAWPVQAAYYIWSTSGADTTRMLADLVSTCGLQQALRPELSALNRREGDAAAWWIEEVDRAVSPPIASG